MRTVDTPQSICRAGAAQCDITPPVGIYHRMWGAATHDRSTGVHRPLVATALALAPAGPADVEPGSPQRQVLVSLDHCLLWGREMAQLERTLVEQTGLSPAELVITFSHTHGAGLMGLERADLPGGNLIAPYLDELARRVAAIVRQALERLTPAHIVYGVGRCDLAQHRDFWDEQTRQIVCGFNPGGPADDTVLVGRVTDAAGKIIATTVNYACHPTTLAWDNTLISPDFVGAMRELVEMATSAPVLFLQGASGDLGPREGYVGDTAVADRNGRQLGYVALSTLESMPPPGTRYEYQGPVVSGATIGVWKHMPLAAGDQARLRRWRVASWTLDLAYRADLATITDTEMALGRWQQDEARARAAGDANVARDCRAQVERMTRQLVRLRALPQGRTFPLPVSLMQIGDAYWLSVSGEEYNELQRKLRARIPGLPLFVTTLAHGWGPSYLVNAESYGRGIYQETVAVLAPGCLEALTESVAARLKQWETRG